jgi:hypothetical protein
LTSSVVNKVLSFVGLVLLVITVDLIGKDEPSQQQQQQQQQQQ